MEVINRPHLKMQLKQLPRNVAIEICDKATEVGCKVLLEEILKRVPVRKGILKKGFKIREVEKDRWGVTKVVGSDYRIAPHVHLVEFGTSNRKTKLGKSTGRVTAKPFIRPAWDVKKTDAIIAAQNFIGKEVLKNMK